MKAPKMVVWWHRLRDSLWLVPSFLTLLAFGGAELMVRLDHTWQDHISRDTPGIYPGSAEGARQVLGTLAGSMVSLTTISFSVMMVVLTLASNQFGPRVLRNFLADRLNQTVLGTFVATFVFCLMVLSRVPNPDEIGHIPRLSVSLALLLTLVSLGMLIAFIHHVARSIQAAEVVRTAHQSALDNLRRLYPEPLGDEPPSNARLPDNFSESAQPLRAQKHGYIQAVNGELLVRFARAQEAIVHLKVMPGDFVNIGDCFAEIATSRALPKDMPEKAQAWLMLAAERSPEQDPRFSLRKLGEIGVRALSPGLNDPHTAVQCLDLMGAVLAELACRSIPGEARLDDDGNLRVWAVRPDLPAIAEAALGSIRNYGCEHPLVMERLIHLLGMLNARLRRPADRQWAATHADRLREQLKHIDEPHSRDELNRALAQAERVPMDHTLVRAASEVEL